MARTAEEQNHEQYRGTTIEMKRRLAKAEGEVKLDTDATERVRVQLNRESQTLQDASKRLKAAQDKADAAADGARLAATSRAKAQDELSMARKKLQDVEVELKEQKEKHDKDAQRMAGIANDYHAQQLNALEQQLTGVMGHNARLKVEIESWTQRHAEATREVGAAKSECSKLDRNIMSLKAQVQQYTEIADTAKASLQAAEMAFEEKRKALNSEHTTETENLRAIMRKASEEAGRMKLELVHADQKREKAESDAESLGRRLQLVNDELATQRAHSVSQGSSQSEFVQLTQTCQAKESTIQNMEMEVANLKKSLIKAESEGSKKEDLENTIQSMTTYSQEQDWKLKMPRRKAGCL